MRFLLCLIVFGMSCTTVWANEVRFKALIESRCVKCHGKVMPSGKKKIKGLFDLSGALKTYTPEQSATWAKALEAISSGQMPPEDSKGLTKLEAALITRVLHAKYPNKHIPERALTITEIRNTYAGRFGYEKESYDPFERLSFIKDSTALFPTVKSKSLVSSSLLKELEYGLEDILNAYVIARREASFRNKEQVALLVAKSSSVFAPVRYPLYENMRDQIIAENQKKAGKDKKKLPSRGWIRVNTEAEKLTTLDVRAKSSPSWMVSRDLRGNGLPAGRYRLEFKAKAMNRAKVRANYEKLKASSIKKKRGVPQPEKALGEWHQLYNEKARLEFIEHGEVVNGFGTLRENVTPGRVVCSFEIEDEAEKKYSAEFELKTPTTLDMVWENGPENRRLWWLKFFKEDKGGEGFDYKWPQIRITSVIKLTRLDRRSAHNPYDISGLNRKSDNSAEHEVRIRKLAEELKFKNTEPWLRLYRNLKGAFPPEVAYKDVVKYLCMTSEALYINTEKDPASFLSYALLKRPPTENFRRRFAKARASGTIRATRLFIRSVVNDPRFSDFVRVFSDEWLDKGIELDEKKYSAKLRALPFDEETVQHILHVIRNNRPVSELFYSPYRVADKRLAEFYDWQEKGLEKFRPGKFQAYTPQGGQGGGILQQPGFFIASSSGVDPLPFKRAAWILENVFHEKLGNPGTVPTLAEVDMTQAKTFKEKLKIHARAAECRSCHDKIDPIAIVMNDYDTIGLYNGRGLDREYMNRFNLQKTQMTEAITKNLMVYILGKELGVHDLKTQSAIVGRAEKNGHVLSDILADIIHHYFIGR
jgi:hypothetical protein